MAIPSDFSRCVGRRGFDFEAETCPKREQCDRYMDWKHPATPNERVPVALWLCADGEQFYIPVPSKG